MTRRRVFISYHHDGEQAVVDQFVRTFSDALEVFSDRSVQRAANSTDTDYLRRICNERIQGTSLTIVIVGAQTGGRKFVDWEINYTLSKGHSLLGILAPGVVTPWVPDRLQDNITSGFAPYYQYPNGASGLREIIEKAIGTSSSLIRNDRPLRSANSTR